MHNLGEMFPIVLCEGYCGIGKSSTKKANVPYFYACCFEKKEEAYFQPEHYFKLEAMPSYFCDNNIVNTQQYPSEEAFISLVEKFKSLPKLEKIVLARTRTHTFKKPFTAAQILSLLTMHFPTAHAFAYIKDKDTAFIGSSPENLYVRYSNTVTVDCLAGTAKDDILFTEKNSKEHQFVTTLVKKALFDVSDNITVSEISIKKAGDLRHIYQTVSATLLEGKTDQDIINALHPTPATLGFPRNLATSFLKEHEPFDRGLYAGVLGWISPEKTLLKVSLRSGLIEKEKLTLFAGAGIIEESIAEEEIIEISNKFNTLEGAFLENTMSN